MKLFDATLSTLERSLDARLLRQNVLAGNLANVDTPGFVPMDVDFETAMATSTAAASTADSSIGTTATGSVATIALDAPRPGPRAMNVATPNGSAPLVVAAGARPGIDGNAVDLDRTMAAMAQNGLQYSAAARAAGKKLSILRYVASDGVA